MADFGKSQESLQTPWNAEPVIPQKSAKSEANVALEGDSLAYLFTGGIIIQIFAVRILNFYNRNLVGESIASYSRREERVRYLF